MKYLFLIAALVGLAGCGATTWDSCKVETWAHPSKPAPARDVRVSCTRSFLCDEYTRDGQVAKCDGKSLAAEGK